METDDLPHEPDWRAALHKAREAARCGAKTRAGGVGQCPAMTNGRCHKHGGASTGAKTAEGLERIARARTAHGRRSAAYVADRRAVAAQNREMRATIKQAKADLRMLWKLARTGQL
ncbi:HGGxSTG domain-containing protein [Methylobacterium phyllosphaerae]